MIESIRVHAGENIGMALDAVRTHRVRSALTILGIVIGITTVVTIGSLTAGVRQGIVTFFLEFGPDNIFLARNDRDPSSPLTLKEQKRKPIEPEYGPLIKASVRAVDDVAVQMFVSSRTSGLLTARVPGYETDRLGLSGYSANSFVIQPRELLAGRFYTPEEDDRAARVAVIGPQIAEALFPDGNAVGRLMTVAGTEIQVVGVLAKGKGNFFGGSGFDNIVIIPLRTAMLKFPTEDRFIVVAKARPGQREEAFEEIRQLMRRIRKTPAYAVDDFRLSTADQIVNQLDSILKIVVGVSIGLASLGLLVGGIGVMNIMLVSVTERTKEIGIRKAIGAKKRDIIIQFLMEAVTLTSIGGLLGITFSVLMTALIGALVPAVAGGVPGWALTLGFGFSVGTGLFFGTWPALKAARLDPVDALRYE